MDRMLAQRDRPVTCTLISGSLIAAAPPDDFVVLFFFGHGVQIPISSSATSLTARARFLSLPKAPSPRNEGPRGIAYLHNVC